MAKQHGAKTMFDQSIVYLFNSYVEQGLSTKEASLRVTQDIEEVYKKHMERSQLLVESNVLTNPVRYVDKALATIDESLGEQLQGKRPTEIIAHHQMVLRSVRSDISYVREKINRGGK